MNNPKHTAAPWSHSNGAIWGVSPFNARVRLAVVTDFSPMNGIDSKANAQVMTAAPEMLNALKALQDRFTECRKAGNVSLDEAYDSFYASLVETAIMRAEP